MIDLHTHTIASDGTYSPEELMAYALTKNLKAIAITDHDTINGLQAAHTYLKQHHIPSTTLELINGIELSANIPKYDFDIHILGLFLDPDNPVFKEGLVHIIQDRQRRNNIMLDLIQKAGYDLTWKEITDYSGDSVITRAHFAKALLKKGYVKTMNEAFDRYLGDGKPCHVQRNYPSYTECIDMIHQAGGIAVVAHPMLYRFPHSSYPSFISNLKEAGLDGIESIYPKHSAPDTRMLLNLCDQHHLLPTGGSDFHGSNKKEIDIGTGFGETQVPYELLRSLKKSIQ